MTSFSALLWHALIPTERNQIIEDQIFPNTASRGINWNSFKLNEWCAKQTFMSESGIRIGGLSTRFRLPRNRSQPVYIGMSSRVTRQHSLTPTAIIGTHMVGNTLESKRPAYPARRSLALSTSRNTSRLLSKQRRRSIRQAKPKPNHARTTALRDRLCLYKTRPLHVFTQTALFPALPHLHTPEK